MNKGFNSAANQAGVKPSCFVAGTLVTAVAGMLAIEKIKSGDKVISTDPETMETSPKTVLETYIREVTTLVHLTVNGEEIITTIDHDPENQMEIDKAIQNLCKGKTVIVVAHRLSALKIETASPSG